MFALIIARRWLVTVVCCGLLFSAQRSFGAIDMFLKLSGIPGESTDATHPREIVALGFSQVVASGGGTTKPSFTDLRINKLVDAATPLLYLNAAQATHLNQAVLTVRSTSSVLKPVEFYQIILTDVIITDVETSGAAGDGRPIESVSLKFARIEWRYVPVNPDGSLGTPIITTWNVAANTP